VHSTHTAHRNAQANQKRAVLAPTPSYGVAQCTEQHHACVWQHRMHKQVRRSAPRAPAASNDVTQCPTAPEVSTQLLGHEFSPTMMRTVWM
jgi:hypothetical protein